MDQNISRRYWERQAVLLPSAVDLGNNILIYLLPALPLDNCILLIFKLTAFYGLFHSAFVTEYIMEFPFNQDKFKRYIVLTMYFLLFCLLCRLMLSGP